MQNLKGPDRSCKGLAKALAPCLIPHVALGIFLPIMLGGLVGITIAIVIPYAVTFRRAWRDLIPPSSVAALITDLITSSSVAALPTSASSPPLRTTAGFKVDQAASAAGEVVIVVADGTWAPASGGAGGGPIATGVVVTGTPVL